MEHPALGGKKEDIDMEWSFDEDDQLWEKLRLDHGKQGTWEQGELCGWLRKKSSYGKKKWSSRWFVLDTPARKLLYFHKRTSKVEGGAIYMDHVEEIYPDSDLPTVFYVQNSNSGRKYAFEAASPNDRTRWLAGLGALVPGHRLPK
eukprot:CAMPEP_0119136046 /NCGR_PEP_ID=MMETSP1310-20130426/20601_1 /TAXON_ID=464262 /ORGANISM="Genus nov. species nov., Strain RCC2339" /LENGTH=145 /DNA_ID=CAMNT_0007127005 /DNA_START=27 /DNA_END=464 /DNA_ORIENTATION=+